MWEVVEAKLGDSVFFRFVEKFAGENGNFVVVRLNTDFAKVLPIIQQEIAIDYAMTFSWYINSQSTKAIKGCLYIIVSNCNNSIRLEKR